MQHRQIVFASFVLAIAIALQAPSVGNKQQAPADQKQQETASANTTTSKQKEESTKQSRWWPPPPLWDTYWPTFALVILAGIAAKLGLETLADIRKQTNAQMIAAKAAKKSADAAWLNAQAVINIERALVDVELGKPTHDIDESTGETTAFFRCGFKITNYGRTVAHIISFGIGTGCFPGYCRFRIEDFETSQTRTEHNLLAAGASVTLFDLDVGHLFPDWSSIQDETKTGMLRLEVRYEDVIRMQTDKSPHNPHRTSAIFYYAPVFEELRRLPLYDVFE